MTIKNVAITIAAILLTAWLACFAMLGAQVANAAGDTVHSAAGWRVVEGASEKACAASETAATDPVAALACRIQGARLARLQQHAEQRTARLDRHARLHAQLAAGQITCRQLWQRIWVLIGQR